MKYHTVTAADIGKQFLELFGRTWNVDNHFGGTIPSDIGKRIYMMGEGGDYQFLQIENDQQRDARTNPPPVKEKGYNGWANYETWNVALWIGNDEGLYSLARDFRNRPNPYSSFVESLKDLGDSPKDFLDVIGPISYQTPDGVAWNDSGLDTDALDAMIREL